MDFSAQRTERTAAVPLDGGFAVGVVLRSGTGDGREFEIDDMICNEQNDARRSRGRSNSQQLVCKRPIGLRVLVSLVGPESPARGNYLVAHFPLVTNPAADVHVGGRPYRRGR